MGVCCSKEEDLRRQKNERKNEEGVPRLISPKMIACDARSRSSSFFENEDHPPQTFEDLPSGGIIRCGNPLTSPRTRHTPSSSGKHQVSEELTGPERARGSLSSSRRRVHWREDVLIASEKSSASAQQTPKKSPAPEHVATLSQFSLVPPQRSGRTTCTSTSPVPTTCTATGTEPDDSIPSPRNSSKRKVVLFGVVSEIDCPLSPKEKRLMRKDLPKLLTGASDPTDRTTQQRDDVPASSSSSPKPHPVPQLLRKGTDSSLNLSLSFGPRGVPIDVLISPKSQKPREEECSSTTKTTTAKAAAAPCTKTTNVSSQEEESRGEEMKKKSSPRERSPCSCPEKLSVKKDSSTSPTVVLESEDKKATSQRMPKSGKSSVLVALSSTNTNDPTTVGTPEISSEDLFLSDSAECEEETYAPQHHPQYVGPWTPRSPRVNPASTFSSASVSCSAVFTRMNKRNSSSNNSNNIPSSSSPVEVSV